MVVVVAAEVATTSSKAAEVEEDGRNVAFSPHSTNAQLDLERTRLWTNSNCDAMFEKLSAATNLTSRCGAILDKCRFSRRLSVACSNDAPA